MPLLLPPTSTVSCAPHAPPATHPVWLFSLLHGHILSSWLRPASEWRDGMAKVMKRRWLAVAGRGVRAGWVGEGSEICFARLLGAPAGLCARRRRQIHYPVIRTGPILSTRHQHEAPSALPVPTILDIVPLPDLLWPSIARRRGSGRRRL